MPEKPTVTITVAVLGRPTQTYTCSSAILSLRTAHDATSVIIGGVEDAQDLERLLSPIIQYISEGGFGVELYTPPAIQPPRSTLPH